MLRIRRQARSFALVDYICGTVILVATVMSVTSINLAKLTTSTYARRQQKANFLSSQLLSSFKQKCQRDAKYRQQAYILANKQKDHGWATVEEYKDGKLLGQISSSATAICRIRTVKDLDSNTYIEAQILIRWDDNLKLKSSHAVSALVVGGNS